MGENLTEISWFKSEETNEAIRELMLDALGKGFVSSLEALVKLSGSVEVVSAMRPHIKLLIHTGFDDNLRIMNIDGKEADSLLAVFIFGQEFAVASDKIEGEITEFGAVGTVHECAFQNSIPETCILLSHLGTEEVCQLLNPQYECIFTHHLTNGDPFCRYIFKRKDQSLPEPENPGRTIAKLPEMKIPDELLAARQTAARVMLWDSVTSAFVHLNGLKRTKEILYPNARTIGEEVGRKLAEIMPREGRDAKSIGELIRLITGILNQRGISTLASKNEFVMQVSDCPCQTLSPEFCGQFGEFINGMVGIMNPEFEFSYDRMITKGEKSCRWMIMKRYDKHLVEDKNSSIENDLKLLTQRFVRGEITKEEYQEMKAILQGN